MLAGLQSAYLRTLQRKFYRAGTTTTVGDKGVSKAVIDKAREDINPYIRNLSVVFEDNPQLSAGIKEAADLLSLIETKAGRAVPPGRSSTFYAAEARSNVGMAVKMIFGPLSRTGTRINAIAAKMFKTENEAELLKLAQARVFNDPVRFSKIATKLVNRETNEIRLAGVADFLRFFAPPIAYSDITSEQEMEVRLELMQAMEDHLKASSTNQQTEELLQE